MKKILSSVWETAKVFILALAIVIPIRYFVFQPFIVKGISMRPNFHNNNYLIVDELSYRFESPQRGDVVVFYYPLNHSERFIKRVIGLPGEEVRLAGEKIIITGVSGKKITLDESNYLPQKTSLGNMEIKLGANDYFVLGDNRNNSFDSRSWGVLPKQDIIGRAIIKIWPLQNLVLIKAPSFSH